MCKLFCFALFTLSYEWFLVRINISGFSKCNWIHVVWLCVVSLPIHVESIWIFIYVFWLVIIVWSVSEGLSSASIRLYLFICVMLLENSIGILCFFFVGLSSLKVVEQMISLFRDQELSSFTLNGISSIIIFLNMIF